MLAAFRLLAAFGLVLAVVLAPLVAAPPARAASHSVEINDGFFSPGNITIAVGDSVTWTNADSSPHTVTANSGVFDSGNLDGGGTFSQTFMSAGTLTYVCSYHDEMVGTITVVTAPEPAATTDAAPSAAPVTGASETGAAAAGAQPNTAMPAPGDLAAWLAPLLIGLGLVALAFGLIPVRPLAHVRLRRFAGWRR